MSLGLSSSTASIDEYYKKIQVARGRLIFEREEVYDDTNDCTADEDSKEEESKKKTKETEDKL